MMAVTGNITGNVSMSNMTTAANMTMSSSCYSMTPYWPNMFRPASDPEYPWVGLWIALPIIGIWYWCTDQVGSSGNSRNENIHFAIQTFPPLIPVPQLQLRNGLWFGILYQLVMDRGSTRNYPTHAGVVPGIFRHRG